MRLLPRDAEPVAGRCMPFTRFMHLNFLHLNFLHLTDPSPTTPRLDKQAAGRSELRFPAQP